MPFDREKGVGASGACRINNNLEELSVNILVSYQAGIDSRHTVDINTHVYTHSIIMI